ncbi:osmoprotectant transport system permease protein [Nocardioides albertanoniae]|uniref:Osmoprotectant transport system permease protein n=1 Tax=Nocardioides albertanoniae TaxID=1175486 RepID=A0A543A8Y6_9ACTN|nr:ABC transporter permease subunit [Nocardioides albertanoniae]TQL69064.1 osmoprotectant transport system permease protein [Nocardioides albertanoniae]
MTTLDPTVTDPGQSVRRSRLRLPGGESTAMLLVLPIVVGVLFIGYVIWRQTADLDSIEESTLAWAAIREQLVTHVAITLVASLIVVIVAVPLGILLTRGKAKAIAPAAVAVANAGQAAPSIGLIVLLAIWLGFSFWTGVLGLVIYGLLPVLRNTITGLQGVDPTLVEAGRGIGMSGAGVLLRVELPLALPVIMAGIRTALVLVVGTAALVTFIGAGGLGGALTSGITLFRFPVMVAAALLIALLALLIEWVGRVLEVVLRPKGI